MQSSRGMGFSTATPMNAIALTSQSPRTPEPLVQEGRSQEAEGRREESLYSKVFNLFSVLGYFCRAALVNPEGLVESFNRSVGI